MIKQRIIKAVIGITGIVTLTACGTVKTDKAEETEIPIEKEAETAPPKVEEHEVEEVGAEDDEAPVFRPVTKYTTTFVRIRTSPEINDSNLLITVNPNTQLTVINDLGDWDEVTFNGQNAYIYESLLSDNPVKIEEPKPKLQKKMAAAGTSNTNTQTKSTTTSAAPYSISAFKRQGVIHYGGFRWTYYSQRVLPGGALKIPGRHVEYGYVCDSAGRIVVACGSLAKGTVISSPLGRQCVVYDSCPTKGTIDVYVD